jgi:hypothetical protein
MIDGKAGILAFLMAMTKGDLPTPEESRKAGSVDGTIRPMMKVPPR